MPNPPVPPPPRPGQPGGGRPRNPYELRALIKGLRPKQMNNAFNDPTQRMQPQTAHDKLIRQQILINILLSYINSPEVTLEVYNSGFDEALSDAAKQEIGKSSPPPPPLID